jgi:hypothetical protein
MQKTKPEYSRHLQKTKPECKDTKVLTQYFLFSKTVVASYLFFTF